MTETTFINTCAAFMFICGTFLALSGAYVINLGEPITQFSQMTMADIQATFWLFLGVITIGVSTVIIR